MEVPRRRPNELSLMKVIPLSEDEVLRNNFMVVEGPLLGNIRFGLMLEIMDRLAADTARMYIHQFYPDAVAITAAIDNIIIRNAADVSKDLIFKSRINYVGRTSMEVGIRIEQPDESGGVHIATCYFTMVARRGPRENRVSVVLPPLEYIDEMEKLRYSKALERKRRYLEQKRGEKEPPSPDEYGLLSSLHEAQDSPNFDGILVSSLVMECWERTFPAYKNPNQTIFGGYLARRAYELSSMCAELIATKRPIIAAVNRINFIHPVLIGDKVLFKSQVAYTRGAFICVEATIYRMGRGEKKISAQSESCLFTFVNVDERLNPYTVPEVYPTTYAEDRRYLEAKRSLDSIVHEIHSGLLKKAENWAT